MTYDIVYILKNEIDDEERIYSVRSVVANFPYNKIWFVGGVPEHIKPDEQINYEQEGRNKWEKSTNTMKKICRSKKITDDFWLFNDDFFVMRKPGIIAPYVRGTLHKRVVDIKVKKGITSYSGKLERTENHLRAKGFDTLDYAMHTPILINKKQALQTIKLFPDNPMFRSLYGNHHKIGGFVTDDVKIQDLKTVPTGDELFLSTTDKSFKEGKVGEYIKEMFPDKCKYEI